MPSIGTKQIQIVVNGQIREIPPQESLAGLLAYLEIDLARVAVELNRTIIRREDWDNTRVDAGSTLEIVQFVGGG